MLVLFWFLLLLLLGGLPSRPSLPIRRDFIPRILGVLVAMEKTLD